MEDILEKALKNRAYHLGKNIGDLTPGQIAEVQADPKSYLPEMEIPFDVKIEEVAVEAVAPKTEPAVEPEFKPRRRKVS